MAFEAKNNGMVRIYVAAFGRCPIPVPTLLSASAHLGLVRREFIVDREPLFDQIAKVGIP